MFSVEGRQSFTRHEERGFGVGKWNGVGGKVEQGETVVSAMIRETKEEIGVELYDEDVSQRAELTFEFEGKSEWNQVCHVFLAKKWRGEPVETEEMKPQWFRVDRLPFESMWVDDPLWLPDVLYGKNINAKFLFSEDGKKVISHEIKTADL